MPHDNEPTPEDMIARLLLAAGYLMEETSPELASPVDQTRDALDARIAVVGRTAEELGAIATAARAMLRMVRPKVRLSHFPFDFVRQRSIGAITGSQAP